MERTVISENNMGFLEGEDRTPSEILEFLKKGAMIRDFGQVLRDVYPGKDLPKRLKEGMARVTGEDPAGVLRKVGNWLKGKNIPKNRETLFQICFVLGLGEKAASKVLGAASETGIHYRNPGEMAYAFGLRTGMEYEDALSLKQQVVKIYEEEAGSRRPKGEDGKIYTRQIRDAFAGVATREEFMDFFQEHMGEMGVLHETAYRKFTELLETLLKPIGAGGEGEEEKYTMEEVVRLYIRMHVPETKRTKDYDILQKLVKKYWPNESSLIGMRNRKEDVSRKALLILYLVTESFDEDEEEDLYLEEDEEDPDTLLEMRLKQMRLFLEMYGMPPLDPGNPFDYLVIYAMRTQAGGFISDRMEAVMRELFKGEEEKETDGYGAGVLGPQ